MSTATGTPSPDSGNVVPAGGAGSTLDAQGGNEGPDVGSYGLSTGAIIGICVAIGAIIVGIVILWSLWFLAKKRGWEVRKSISRVSRRVTGRFDAARSRRASTAAVKSVRLESRSPPRAYERDLEKGAAGVRVKTAAVMQAPNAKKDRMTATMAPQRNNPFDGDRPSVADRHPPAASADVVQSRFDAETPVVKSFREKYMKRPGGS